MDSACESCIDVSDSTRDLEESNQSVRGFIPENETTYKSKELQTYPIFDLRLAGKPGLLRLFKKIETYPHPLPYNLKSEMCRRFHVTSSMVHIIEDKDHKERAVVILPGELSEETVTLLVEVYATDNTYKRQWQNVFCFLVSPAATVSDLKNAVKEELNENNIILCANGKILNETVNVRSIPALETLQVVVKAFYDLNVVHQPRTDAKILFTLHTDSTKSAREVKRQFCYQFRDWPVVSAMVENKSLQLCYQEKILSDNVCIGLLAPGQPTEEIELHFTPPDFISFYLKYPFQGLKFSKLVTIGRNVSTAELRAAASKYMHVDPKAVKLLCNNKRVEEHDNLSVLLGDSWENGCCIIAGVKKCKTLKMKNPMDNREEAFKIYVLDPVSILKKQVAERFGLNKTHISLSCRDIELENSKLLQLYPIKNNMEIALNLLENRLVLRVFVQETKQRHRLLVDDCTTITVEDVLIFCIDKCQLKHACLCAVYKGKCLDTSSTLSEAGIEANEVVSITYNENDHLFAENVIDIFMVSADGLCTCRTGIMTQGILIPVPDGVDSSKLREIPRQLEKLPTPAGIYLLKPKSFPREQDLQSFAMGNENAELFVNEEMEKQFPIAKPLAPSVDNEDWSETDNMTGEVEVDTTAVYAQRTEDGLNKARSSVVKTNSLHCRLEEDCRIKTNVNNIPLGHKQDTVNEEQDVVAKKGTEKKSRPKSLTRQNHVSFSETSGYGNQVSGVSGQELTYRRGISEKLFTVSRLQECDIKVANVGDQAKVIHNHSDALQRQLCNVSWNVRNLICSVQSPILLSRQANQTVTSNRNFLYDTFPPHQWRANANIETAGITLPLISHVAYNLGQKWRQLLRFLNVGEMEISDVQYLYGSLGLEEVSTQALLTWKREKGEDGSKDVLFNALKEIGLTSIIDSWEKKVSNRDDDLVHVHVDTRNGGYQTE